MKGRPDKVAPVTMRRTCENGRITMTVPMMGHGATFRNVGKFMWDRFGCMCVSLCWVGSVFFFFSSKVYAVSGDERTMWLCTMMT